MDFKTGDLVRLKSGGPVMTVDSVGEGTYDPRPHAWCVWFEKVGSKNNVNKQAFHVETIEAFEKPATGTTFGAFVV